MEIEHVNFTTMVMPATSGIGGIGRECQKFY